MKSWYIKFRISDGADSKRQLSERMQQAISRDETLREFQLNVSALDQNLRGGPIQKSIDSDLHSSIMLAVRNSSRSNHPAAANPVGKSLWRWIPAPAFAAFLLFGFWLATRNSSAPPTQAVVPQPELSLASTLSLGNKLSSSAPEAILSPLTQEFELINKDLKSTADFLMANLP